MRKPILVLFEALDRRWEAKGQVARTLLALVAAGEHGVTAAEISSWALRLAAYCFVLRRDYHLTIDTIREPHEGGWHGRHVLRTPVRVISVEPMASNGMSASVVANAAVNSTPDRS